MIRNMRKNVILCMKWGSAFNAAYVNTLFNAVQDHITVAHDFVCITDDRSGLADEIYSLPIPDIGLSEEQIKLPGVWRKLSLFHPDVAALGLGRRALFIDLDMMIMGSIDRFFDPTEPMVMLDTGKTWSESVPVQPSTGIFLFTLGEQLHILDRFQKDISSAIKNYRNEQDFVAAHAEGVVLWEDDLVISFKKHLVHRYCRDLFKEPQLPEKKPPILAFHGSPRPKDIIENKLWGKFPHIGRGPISWAKEYWETYSK